MQTVLANHWNAAAAVSLPRACHGLKPEYFLTDLIGKKISPTFNEYIYNSIHSSVLKNPKFYWFIHLLYKRKVSKRKKQYSTAVLQGWSASALSGNRWTCGYWSFGPDLLNLGLRPGNMCFNKPSPWFRANSSFGTIGLTKPHVLWSNQSIDSVLGFVDSTREKSWC